MEITEVYISEGGNVYYIYQILYNINAIIFNRKCSNFVIMHVRFFQVSEFDFIEMRHT